MSRIQLLNGVRYFVPSQDHCEPHAHAFHKGERWEGKFEFSFLNNDVVDLGFQPPAIAPKHAVRHAIGNNIAANLKAYRDAWWNTYKCTCLDNKWIFLEGGNICVLNKKPKKQQVWQILSSSYDVQSGQTTIECCEDSSGQITMATF